jgi:hypothetical protein
MSASPIEIVGQWLQNLANPDVINKVVSPDAAYVSLNNEDTELKKMRRGPAHRRARRRSSTTSPEFSPLGTPKRLT